MDQGDERLRELYRLQETWAPRAAAGDEAAQRIAGAIEALIIEYELARPTGGLPVEPACDERHQEFAEPLFFEVDLEREARPLAVTDRLDPAFADRTNRAIDSPESLPAGRDLVLSLGALHTLAILACPMSLPYPAQARLTQGGRDFRKNGPTAWSGSSRSGSHRVRGREPG